MTTRSPGRSSTAAAPHKATREAPRAKVRKGPRSCCCLLSRTDLSDKVAADVLRVGGRDRLAELLKLHPVDAHRPLLHIGRDAPPADPARAPQVRPIRGGREPRRLPRVIPRRRKHREAALEQAMPAHVKPEASRCLRRR